MKWRDLFVPRTRPPSPEMAEGVRSAGSKQPMRTSKGTFITPQTLTSFATASTVIGVVTRVFTELVPDTDGQFVAAITASIIGIVIFAINVSDPESKPEGARSWLISSVVGFVNTIYLVAVSLGVFEVVAGT